MGGIIAAPAPEAGGRSPGPGRRRRDLRRHSRDSFPDNGFLRGSDNQYVGRYDPHTNQTWDISGNLVGFGNLLTSLLRRR